MNAKAITDQISRFIEWCISHPFAAMLWVSACILTFGLFASLVNPLTGNHLPALGFTAQTGVYAAGVVYLLKGQV